MKDKKTILSVFIGVLILATPCFANFKQEIVDGKRVVKFSTNHLELPGEIYNQPIELKLITKDAVNFSSPVDTLESMYSSNKIGDAQWIMKGFTEEDKEGMKNLVSDPQILKKNTDFFALMKQANILGVVEYGQYKIYLIEQVFDRGSYMVPVALINVSGQWLRTNVLKADKTFDAIFMSIS